MGDENENRIDVPEQNVNENEQEAPKYDIENMHMSDISAIISELTACESKAAIKLNNSKCGLQLQETVDALNQLVYKLQSGPHIEFANKNKWLGNKAKREEFLKGFSIEQTYEERKALVDLYVISVGTKSLVSDFAKYISDFIDNILGRAYYAIRFYYKMSEKYKISELYRIMSAFNEFDGVMKEYNDAHILKEMSISKEYSYEDNYEMVLDHMDARLCRLQYIGDFLVNTQQTNAYGANQLHVTDRDTKEFDDYASREDRMRQCLTKTQEFKDAMDQYYIAYPGIVSNYFDAFNTTFNGIEELLNAALDVINNFKTNSTDAPYAIMHYSPTVIGVANNWLYMSLSADDPLKKGTRYNEMAVNMIKRCKELAKSVAKNAP